ncbi:MAG: hypothetical protein QM296_00875 [Bacillota bacterium]|nr:hypothetical protein [Bacillota bacterium]
MILEKGGVDENVDTALRIVQSGIWPEGGQKSRYCPWNRAISKFLTREWTKITVLRLESGNSEDFDQRVDKNHGIAPGIGQYRSF